MRGVGSRSFGSQARAGLFAAIGLILTIEASAAAPVDRPARPPFGAEARTSPPSDRGKTADARSGKRLENFVWEGRFGVGLMFPNASPEEDTLELDGYDNTVRVGFGANGDRFFSDLLGVGVWGALLWRSRDPTDQGPRLHETVYFLGGDVPFRAGDERIELIGAPRLGVAWKVQAFGADVAPLIAFAYGAELALAFPQAHVALSMAWIRATAQARGFALEDDAGGFSMMFQGLIDG